MPLSSSLKQSVMNLLETYCRDKVPPHVADKLRLGYQLEGTLVTLFEERPPWQGFGPWTRTPVARFRYNLSRGLWTLYWLDRNSKWHRYPQKGPTKTLPPLIREVDKDPIGIFWG